MKEKVKGNPSFIEALSCLLSLILLILIGNLIFGLSTNLMFVIATFYVCFIGIKCGKSYKELKDGMIDTVASNAEILCIMLGIGFLIGSWVFAGTVPVMIAWLASLISVKYVLVLSFIFCGVIAAIIGTSSATMGTIGVIMLSVAMIEGVSPGIAAAAVICGSFIGQVSSVVADMVNWNASLTGNTPQSLVKLALPAEIVGIAASIIFFFVAGMNIKATTTPETLTQVHELVANVLMCFKSSPIVLLPVLVLFFCIWKKMDTLPTLFTAGFVALAIGIFYQGFSVQDAFEVAYSGFTTEMLNVSGQTFMPQFESLVTRGGMTAMTDFLISIPLMMAYCGALDKTGAAKVFANSLFHNVRKPGNAIAVNTLTSLFLCAATGSVMAPGILGTQMFTHTYEKNGLSRRNMAVSYQFTCAMGALLFPWTAVCLYAQSIVGVAAKLFIPYLVLVYVPIIVYIIFGYLGIGIVKLKDDKMTKPITLQDDESEAEC
ncbi:MAG: hypothetical protein LKJ83_04100 [Eubacteriaceae bacterium]|nr:hypothetical protein [Eubacteriaceae bacterium]